jgi:acyl carrier protein
LEILILRGENTMDLNDFIAKFAELFEDTDKASLKADTEFKTLDEWSSLIALSVLAMVDEEYDIQLKGDDVKNSETIEDLFNKVKAKK